MIQRGNDVVRMVIKWNEDDIGETKVSVTLELRKKNHRNVAEQKLGDSRHNLHNLDKRINY